VQAGHQREQQGALGQSLQPVAAKDGPLQKFRPPPGIVGVQAAQQGYVSVPAVHKAAHLSLAEGGQHRLGKARQAPVLLLVGVGAAGDQHPATGKGGGEILDRLLDLLPPAAGLRHLVQPVEQEQATPLLQLPAQVGGVPAQGGGL